MDQILFGINPVLELLHHEPQKVQQLFLPVGTLSGKKKLVYSLARSNNIKIQRIPNPRFEKLAGGTNHQGVIAEIAAYTYQDIETVLERWKASQEKALFVVLDGIEDPHNLGAIIRTAYVAGAHGVIVPKHRCAPLNSTTAKASAGAMAHIPVCRVPNLAAALRLLKEEGIWIGGAAEKADQSLYESDLTLDLAIVIGSEGKGMHELTKKTCDFLIAIPAGGKIQSLNASVAAGVVLFEVVRQRLGNTGKLP